MKLALTVVLMALAGTATCRDFHWGVRHEGVFDETWCIQVAENRDELLAYGPLPTLNEADLQHQVDVANDVRTNKRIFL